MPPLHDPTPFYKVREDHRCIHTNCRALRQFIAERENHLLFNAATVGANRPMFDVDEHMPDLLSTIVRNGDLMELFHARAALEIIEASTLYREAAAIVDPLLEADALASKALSDEQQRAKAELKRKRVAFEEAQERVQARARELMEKDPTFAKARAEFEQAAARNAELQREG